ncbi:MAG: Spo0B domain-containing protein [Herbinix sp.]|nr:Spo0B domain-containing protein [Herbinix sp.]
MNIKKIASALLLINVLQFILGLSVWNLTGRTIMNEVSSYVYVSIGLMLLSSVITIIGLYFAIRYKNDDYTETIKNLEELNTKIRAQRHDYLNHFQVIYGLMELEEYEEAKKYIDPVFKDILKISKALKTAQPAVNALLQAKMEAAEKNKIDLFLEIHSDLKSIPIEPWNLCKVLANIIDNSITALEGVGPEKIIKVEIGEDSINYNFQVRNNGPVIPKDHINDIFKKGYTTSKKEEHGMGLYIVSKIVREANGAIWVDSDTDRTSFHIQLPKKFRA